MAGDFFSVLKGFQASKACKVKTDEKPYVRQAYAAERAAPRSSSQRSERMLARRLEETARPARGVLARNTSIDSKKITYYKRPQPRSFYLSYFYFF